VISWLRKGCCRLGRPIGRQGAPAKKGGLSSHDHNCGGATLLHCFLHLEIDAAAARERIHMVGRCEARGNIKESTFSFARARQGLRRFVIKQRRNMNRYSESLHSYLYGCHLQKYSTRMRPEDKISLLSALSHLDIPPHISYSVYICYNPLSLALTSLLHLPDIHQRIYSTRHISQLLPHIRSYYIYISQILPFLFLIQASTNALNGGEGLPGRDLNSGWN